MIRKNSFVLVTLLLCLAYSIVRYNICGPVSYNQIPVYIVNKAISFAGILLLGVSLITGPFLRAWQATGDHPLHPRRLGTAGFILTVTHSFMSLLLLNRHYFAKFFGAEQRMTWQAESSMLAGIVALGLLLWQAWISGTRQFDMPENGSADNNGRAFPRLIGIAVLAIGMIHLVFMGYGGWLHPEDWHGGLPPITLLTFLSCILFLATRTAVTRVGTVNTPVKDPVYPEERR